MQGLRIVYMQGDIGAKTALEPLVKDKNTRTVSSYLAGMKQVVIGKANFSIGYTTSNYLIWAYQLTGIESVYVDLSNAVPGVVSVRGDRAELVSILNKGIQAGPLFFGSVNNFLGLFDVKNDPKDIIIEFKYSRVADHSAIEAIDTLAERYANTGKKLHLRHLSEDCKKLLTKAAGLVEVNVIEDPKYKVADDRLA